MTCRHWTVVAPEILTPYSEWEPQEAYRPFVELEADTAKEAMVKAVAHKDMREWVQEARGDNKNPFGKLKAVQGVVCDHGIYICCMGDCIFCNIEFKQERFE